MRKDKFVDAASIKVSKTQDYDGKRLTHWTKFENHKRTEAINQDVLNRYEANDAIQIISKKQLANGKYEVKIREGIAPLTKLKGYVPHFFHTYRVVIKDVQGKQLRNIIVSGRTKHEAIKIAEDWLKNNTLAEGSDIYISPRAFDFDELNHGAHCLP